MIEPTQADRDAAADWLEQEGLSNIGQATNIQLGHLDDNTLVQAIAHARIEGAERMREAAAKDAEEWFPENVRGTHHKYGVVASIRALSPADVVKERT